MAMNLCDPVDTPWWKRPNWMMIKEGKKAVDPSHIVGMIAPFLIIQPVDLRPTSICYFACGVAPVSSSPKPKSTVHAIKKDLFRYLKGTVAYGSSVSKDSSFATNRQWQDADHSWLQDTPVVLLAVKHFWVIDLRYMSPGAELHHMTSPSLFHAAQNACGKIPPNDKRNKKQLSTDAIPETEASHCPQGKEIWKRKQKKCRLETISEHLDVTDG
ncbi:hypothetical protein Tco_1503602 [Tanacetum coccineum]